MISLYRQYFENIYSPELNKGDSAIDVFYAILLSWPFVILKFFIEFVLTYVFLEQVATNLMNPESFYNLYDLFSRGSLQFGYIFLLLTSFFSMIFFPFWGSFSYFLWRVILNIYFWALKIENRGRTTEEIICASFSAYSFYFIPIIGDFCTSIARSIILFIGLKRRLEISAFAALLIILTPFLFFGLLLSASFLLGQLIMA